MVATAPPPADLAAARATDAFGDIIASSPFPPGFDGNPWSYGFALFGLTLICALSLAMLLQFVFEARARREAWRFSAVPTPAPMPFATPLSIHRMIITGFLLTILLGALPDVLVLFWWGEASVATMNTLFLMDRVCDGLTLVPFTVSVGLSAWGLQVIPQQLVRKASVPIKPPTWSTIKDQAKIILMVMVVAAGVTVSKAMTGA